MNDTQGLLRDLRRAGWRIDANGTHYRAYTPDRSRFVVLAKTPSDSRSLNNAVANLRKAGYRPFRKLARGTKLSAAQLVADLLVDQRLPERFTVRHVQRLLHLGSQYKDPEGAIRAVLYDLIKRGLVERDGAGWFRPRRNAADDARAEAFVAKTAPLPPEQLPKPLAERVETLVETGAPLALEVAERLRQELATRPAPKPLPRMFWHHLAVAATEVGRALDLLGRD